MSQRGPTQVLKRRMLGDGKATSNSCKLGHHSKLKFGVMQRLMESLRLLVIALEITRNGKSQRSKTIEKPSQLVPESLKLRIIPEAQVFSYKQRRGISFAVESRVEHYTILKPLRLKLAGGQTLFQLKTPSSVLPTLSLKRCP